MLEGAPARIVAGWMLAVAACAAVPGRAAAQGFLLERHRAPALPEDLLWLERPAPFVEGTSPAVRLGLSYADDPLVAADPVSGERRGVEDQLGVHAGVGTSIGHRLHLGASWTWWWQHGNRPDGGALGAVGLGDVTLNGRAVLLDQQAPLELGVAASLRLPVGESADLAADDGPSGALRLLAGRALDANGSWVGASLGVGLRPGRTVGNLRLGHELQWVLGGRWGVTERVGLTLELAGSTVLRRAFDGRHTPLEVTAGAGYTHPAGWTVRTGVGAGLTPGYGSPDARVMVALGYRYRGGWGGSLPEGPSSESGGGMRFMTM